jgi:hypothetical protein
MTQYPAVLSPRMAAAGRGLVGREHPHVVFSQHTVKLARRSGRRLPRSRH